MVLALLLLFFGNEIFGGTDTGTAVTDEVEAGLEESDDDTTPATTTPPADDSSDEASPTTELTTTSEPSPPAVRPATAWERLGADTNTSNFASLAGPLGFQELLEDESAETEFTVFAPSDLSLIHISEPTRPY